MRILNIHGAGDVRLDPRIPPRPGKRDAVVRIRACGVCGSDLTYINRGRIMKERDGVVPLGHEAAGEVMELGEEVDGIALGQRVVLNPMKTPSLVGSGGPEGAFSEEILVAGVQPGTLLPFPDDLPFEIAALAEPLAVALHGVNRAGAAPGDKVAVFGCGPIGLGMIIWLIDRGVTDIVACDLSDERLERAMALGARATVNPASQDVSSRLSELHGREDVLGRPAAGTDIFMDAAGGRNLVQDIVRMGKTHARLVITAMRGKDDPIDFSALLLNEMTITSAMGYPDEMPAVVEALPRLKDKASSLISHRFAFDDVLEALKVAGTAQSAKVMVSFDHAS